MQHVWERVEVHIGFTMGKPEGKSPLGRPRRRWDDNIKMDLQEMSWRGGGAWAGLIWFRIATGGGSL
jgi:hypothetical protein